MSGVLLDRQVGDRAIQTARGTQAGGITRPAFAVKDPVAAGGCGEIRAAPVQTGRASASRRDFPKFFFCPGKECHHFAGMRLVSECEATIQALRILEKDGPSALAAIDALQ